MKIAHSFSLLILALFCLAAEPATRPAPPAQVPAAMAPDNFDFKVILGDPPADGSAEQKQEIETMLDLQAHRTPEEIARCNTERSESPFIFGDEIFGSWFNGKDLPLTSALMKDVARYTSGVVGPAKKVWQRKRPYLSDERIKPCIPLESSTSYPSGHSTRGTVWADILAEMFPEHRDALLAHSKQFGTDRTLGGVHYPSDVVAGQKLGHEIAKRLLADPEFLAKIEKAKDECLAAAHH